MPIDFSNIPDATEKNKGIDFSGIPDVPVEVAPKTPEARFKLEQGTDPTFWQELSRTIFEDPEKERAKAANALGISESFGISPSEAYEYHDEISEEVGLKGQPTTPELMGEMMKLPIVGALMSHPVGAIIGLAGFQAIGEAENAVVSAVKGEKYQFMGGKGIADLLPEQAEATTKELVESMEFAALLLLGFKVGKASPKFREKVLRQMVVEHKAPRSLWVDPADLKTELQRGNILPPEEMDIIKGLGLSGPEYRQAIKDGIHIELPAEKIVTMTDRPWWGKLKKVLKLDPVQESRVVGFEGEPTYHFGETGKAQQPGVKPAAAATPALIEAPQLETPKRIRSEALDAEKWFPIPEQSIPIERIDEYSELAGEATRRAVEKIKKQYEKEDIQIKREAKKEAAGMVERDPQYAIFKDIIDRGRINRQSLWDMGVRQNEITRLNNVRPGLISNTGELHADKVAQEYGYDSVDEMIQDWIYRKPKKTMIEELAQQLADEELIGADSVRDMVFNETVVDEEIKILNKMLKKKPHKMKGAKKIIRQNTGQIKISKILEVKERDVLRDQIRLEAKAARDAFRAGRREAALKHKERQKKLLQQKREREQLRQHVLKLGRQITRKPGKSINYHYAAAIRSLQEGITPKFVGKRTIEQRRRYEALRLGNPDAFKEMSPKTLKKIDNYMKRGVNEFTLDELEDLAAQVELLRKLGLKKSALKKARFKKEVRQNSKQISTTLNKAKPPKPPKPHTEFTDKKFRPAVLWEKTRAWTLQPARIFDMVDGRAGYEGLMHEIFYRVPNRLTDVELRATDKRLSSMSKQMKRLNIKPKHLGKKRIVKGQPFLVDELIDIYNKAQNPKGYAALVHGNFEEYPPDVARDFITTVINSLSKQEREFGDLIINDFALNFDRLNEARIENANEAVKWEENYTPMHRKGIEHKTFDDFITDEGTHRKQFRRVAPNQKFFIPRKDIGAEYQKPLRLGAFEQWSEMVTFQEHYIAIAKHVKFMRSIINNSEVRAAIDEKLGAEYIKVIEKYIEHFVDPDAWRTFQSFEKAVRTIRQNQALTYLPLNAMTVAKQFPSLFLYLRDAGPYYLTRSLLEFSTGVGAYRMIKFVRERAPQIKFVSIERELDELRKMRRGVWNKYVRGTARDLMVFIKLADIGVKTVGWYAVYLKNLRKFGEAGAIDRAMESTNRTQPVARAKDLPMIYRYREEINMPLQFSRQLSQIHNILTYDIPSDFRQKRFALGTYATMGAILTAVFIWAVIKQRWPETPKEYLEAVGQQAVSSLPLFGRYLNAYWQGYYSNSGPLQKIAGAGYEAGQVFKKDGTPNVNIIGEVFGLLGGFPFTGTKRAWEAAATGDVRKLLGKPPKEKRRR